MYPGGNVIRVTPTLDAGTAYAANDVLFASTEIPNSVSSRGGVSKLLRVELYNHKDTTCDMDIIFTQNQADLGTVNSAVASGSLWTEALVKSSKFLAAMVMDVGDTEIDLINGLTSSAQYAGSATINNLSNGILLQASGGSTSVYFSGVDRTGSIDFGADDLEFIFHIEYLG